MQEERRVAGGHDGDVERAAGHAGVTVGKAGELGVVDGDAERDEIDGQSQPGGQVGDFGDAGGAVARTRDADAATPAPFGVISVDADGDRVSKFQHSV